MKHSHYYHPLQLIHQSVPPSLTLSLFLPLSLFFLFLFLFPSIPPVFVYTVCVHWPLLSSVFFFPFSLYSKHCNTPKNSQKIETVKIELSEIAFKKESGWRKKEADIG